jgi:RNA polymerase sigma-70 factor (ECF subfamily)
MNDNKADMVIWHAFKEGDRDAFDKLFRYYYPSLVQYGSRICPDNHILDDCIQDLFIELWQSRSTTRVQSVKAYLLKALKYKLYKQIRRGKPLENTASLQENMSFEISHDHFIIRREDELQRVKMIMEAINKLPGRQKEIIYLKIYQRLSYEEISEVMSINYQVARNLLSQALRSLKKILLVFATVTIAWVS